jgi:chaperone required for assembly of F1-ATPase
MTRVGAGKAGFHTDHRNPIAGYRRNLLISFICVGHYRIVRASLSLIAGSRMRELFDEVAGHSPPDPQEAVRRATRAPQRKRFYKDIGTAATVGGFAVTLDGKPIRTPSRRKVVAPTSGIAAAIAAEWNAQGETIDPLTMPLTRFANSVAEVTDRADAVADDVAKYLGSDLLFYRAGHPEALVAREAAFWDPVLAWAANALGAHFILSEGIVHVTQPEQAIKAARGVFPADPWSVAALHLVTTVTGSALLALALLRGALDSDEVWAAAHVDDDWNVEKWGVDEEVAARRAARFMDFRAAVTILDELRTSSPPSG